MDLLSKIKKKVIGWPPVCVFGYSCLRVRLVKRTVAQPLENAETQIKCFVRLLRTVLLKPAWMSWVFVDVFIVKLGRR